MKSKSISDLNYPISEDISNYLELQVDDLKYTKTQLL